MNIKQFIKKPWVIWLYKITFLWPTMLFILISTLLFAYMYWPKANVVFDHFEIGNDSTYLVINSHGVNDSPNSWPTLLKKAIQTTHVDELSNYKVQVINIDWQLLANNPISCAVQGKRIGEQIGKKIAQKPQVTVVHAVAHSCGAFVNYGICLALKQLAPEKLVQTTYLDPVSVYAGIWWHYGVHRFGSCADFSDAYIDTEDGVPGSNVRLPHSRTQDVTSLKNIAGVAAHAWPTYYYVQAYQQLKLPILTEKNAIMRKE